VDKHLFRALAQYWNPAYNCFTFGKVDLVPTVEEYTTLLRCPRIQADKAYSRAANILNFLKKLMSIMGMNTKKRVDVFALSIYGLVIFLKALGHIDEAVSDLFDRLDKRVMPISVILVETFRSLNACQRFIPIIQGLAQCEFAYKGDNYKKKVHEISNAWNQTHKMKRFASNPITTTEYDWWWGKRVNDNIPVSSEENTRPMEEHLQVIPFELEIIKTAGLGKASEQWLQEIKEEKIRADQWERNSKMLEFEKLL
ncbi:hypothetical protein Goari_019609, partial [Gossypium aridum]|nr:hypothetical protein [Gossypium aridum]